VIQSAALVEPDAPNGEVFLLNMGEPIRIVDLARRFIELHGLAPWIANSPNTVHESSQGSVEIAVTGIRPGEKLFEELAFDTEAMRPTSHSDINIWVVPPANTQQVDRFLALLDPENIGRFTTTSESGSFELREIIMGLIQPVNSHKVFSYKDLHQTAA
jgi:FlaA1/EpsC-like NDP-sugar epimerase